MITPEQIDAKQFKTTRLREGYDPDDVDEFLDAILVSYREILVKLSHAVDTVERLRNNATQAIPPVLGDMAKLLSVAQQTADQTVSEANGEAGRIIAHARKECTDIVESGHEQRTARIAELEDRRIGLEQHVDALQKAMEAARSRMQGALAEIGDGPA